MRILSYRGPSAPGGVSNALAQIFQVYEHSGEWWFFRDNELHCKQGQWKETSYPVDAVITEKHYRYSNNFLWPVLHDLPQFARYCEQEHRCYRAFNSAVVFRMRRAQKQNLDNCFVNDYQFALVPQFLKNSVETSVFWHIPWPINIVPAHVSAMTELAVGLLHSRVVGFHTKEYQENFFRFVLAHLPQYEVNAKDQSIRLAGRSSSSVHHTQFVVAPLGIDTGYWNAMSRVGSLSPPQLLHDGLPYILSIDRADYTKGIRERIAAIDCFFTKYPQWLGKVSFIQVGTRSRQGLPEFDRYWQDCLLRANTLNASRSIDTWRPLVWIDTPMPAVELATIYRRAAVMLVSPLRDGLNLTAKEYVACQQSNPGALALSPGAGVWKELGQDTVPLEPQDPIGFADSILESLQLSGSEKLRRSRSMKNSLLDNTLSSWWQSFRQVTRQNGIQETSAKVCS